MIRLFTMERICKLLPSLDVIFLALILCMNINKYFFGSNDLISYSIFLLFVVVSFCNDPIFLQIHIKNRYICISTVLLCTSAMIGSVGLGVTSMLSSVKLLITVVIAYFSSRFSMRKIKQTLVLIAAYTLIYNVSLLTNPTKATLQIYTATQNYLNLTTILGGALSMFLCHLLLVIYGVSPKKGLIPTIVSALFILLGLTRFAARGPILIPIITAFLVFLMLAPTKPFRLYAVVLLVLIGGSVGFEIYVRSVNVYALQRMMRLFNTTHNELRVNLWIDYLNEVINRHWYLIGGGAEASRIKLGYYPHNLYFQLVGEFGIIGILFSTMTTFFGLRDVLCFKVFVLKNRDSVDKVIEETVFICLSIMLYFFFTFMKSFSFFDAYPLFILYVFTRRSISELLTKGKS